MERDWARMAGVRTTIQEALGILEEIGRVVEESGFSSSRASVVGFRIRWAGSLLKQSLRDLAPEFDLAVRQVDRQLGEEEVRLVVGEGE